MSSLYERSLNVVETFNINLLNSMFIAFTVMIVIFGSLVTLIENYIPDFIKQSYRYGKFSFKGPTDPVINKMEVPKSWFKHFYVFAFGWSVLILFLILNGFLLRDVAPEIFLRLLDLMAGGRKRPAKISSSIALVVAVLMTMQCARRFYETNFIQIFSKKSKMNIFHYLVGYFHYFGVILAVVANTEGFVRGTLPTGFSFTNISLLHYLCIFVFHLSWTQQHKSNAILINLRKDLKTGKVVAAEKHLMPRGGFFELISSPHLFFEIVLYIATWGLLHESITSFYILIWVLSNQVISAILTHQWYKENFENYPKNRRAIIPYVL